MRPTLRHLYIAGLVALVLFMTVTVGAEVAAGDSLGEIGLSAIGWGCGVMILLENVQAGRAKRG